MSRFTELTPGYYLNAPEHDAVQRAIGAQVEAIQSERDDFLAQMVVDTATWGLERWWEPMFGITPDAGKSYAQRRERVKAKKRGHGTTTREMIRNVAAAFSNGEVDILEFPAKYRFVVKFVGTFGLPPGLEDLSDTLDEIKPAHLTYAYEMIYRTCGTLGALTYAQLHVYSNETLRSGQMDGSLEARALGTPARFSQTKEAN